MNTKLNFSKEDITFNGTENEKKLKEELFNDSLLIAQKDKEIERLNNIIKEAREYIEKHTDKLKTTIIPKIDFNYKELLGILDKVEENK